MQREGPMSKSNGSKPGTRGNPMTPQAASRITSATAKTHGGGVAKGSFAARAESAAHRPSTRK